MILKSKCNICAGDSPRIFDSLILQKYSVAYFQCERCGFIQTDKAFWLSESYHSVITDLDIGLISRNLQFAELLEKILLADIINPNGKFIDYGGGYGMLVRLMRDKGFEFYRQDIYCQNIFAKHFDISDLTHPYHFELLTAFEVLEHLEDPLSEIEIMLSLSDNILFSTELSPSDRPTPSTWWYFAPETGQHISFYTLTSLEILAEKFKLNFYSDGMTLHMFSKKKLKEDPFKKAPPVGRLKRLLSIFKPESPVIKRESLLMKDFSLLRDRINAGNKNQTF